MREYHKDQCSRIMEELKNQGAELCEGKNGLVEVNQEFTASARDLPLPRNLNRETSLAH